MIIFGIGGHIDDIGGVENSIRSMLQVCESDECVILVSHAKAGSKTQFRAPDNLKFKSIEYSSRSWLPSPLNRIYQKLKRTEDNGIAICRHHKHVIAARKAGLKCVYLVPSLIANQVKVELGGRLDIDKLQLVIYGLLNHLSQKRALREANMVAVFSKNMAAQVSELAGSDQIQDLIHCKPGIDPNRFMSASSEQRVNLRRQLGLDEDAVQLLMVCRLVSAKGIDLAIKALACLKKNVHLVLVGDGSEKASFQDIVDQLGLPSRVHFAGSQSQVELYYQCSDAFIMASRYEPLGQTILEAGASGLPIVAFSSQSGVTTATDELELGKFVFFAHKLTSESLACAIEQAIESTLDRSHISQHFHEKFSWQTLLQTLRHAC
jgi:glycosyltransferase involved in cell wall biosynthesis